MYTFLTGPLVQWENLVKTTSLVYLYIQYNTSGMVADVIREMHCILVQGFLIVLFWFILLTSLCEKRCTILGLLCFALP